MTVKVDLTENGDFQDKSIHNVAVTGGMARSSKAPEFVTKDEYDAIILFERVFGKEEHEDERIDIFNEKPFKYEASAEGISTCRLFPWNPYSLKRLRVPWLKVTNIDNPTRRIKEDLFGLR